MDELYGEEAQNQEVIMFYNLENLFVPTDTKGIQDKKNFNGFRSWTKGRYLDKLYKIADVFEQVQQKYGKRPIFAGVSEVQGEQPLKDLMTLAPFHPYYDFIHFNSLDERGIDVALIYNTLEIEVLDSETITYLFEIEDNTSESYDTTRDILYCKLKYQEDIFHVYVLHLPSRREKDVNKPKRDYILSELKERVRKNIENENEPVIILGDFNTNPDDVGIRKMLAISEETAMYNPFSEIYKSRIFSTFHHTNGLLFDQIMVSPDFKGGTTTLQFLGAEVFTSDKLRSNDKRFRGRPFRTYAGSRYIGGYSDHFPVIMKFNTQESKKQL